jgi:hypothetical protein
MLHNAGPPLPVDVPLTIMGPSGSYVRTDNTTGMTYTGSGSGSTAPEQYTAYHAGNTSDRSPVLPGQTTLLQSEQTGMWCRLAPLPSNGTQIGMVCDQPTAATAVPFTYTGDGLAVDGVKLVAPGPGQPLLLANTTLSAPVNATTADDLTLSPVTTPTGARWGGIVHSPAWQAHCCAAAMHSMGGRGKPAAMLRLMAAAGATAKAHEHQTQQHPRHLQQHTSTTQRAPQASASIYHQHCRQQATGGGRSSTCQADWTHWPARQQHREHCLRLHVHTCLDYFSRCTTWWHRAMCSASAPAVLTARYCIAIVCRACGSVNVAFS